MNIDHCLPESVGRLYAQPQRWVGYRSGMSFERGERRMAMSFSAETMVEILRDTVIALVRKDGPDLTARQLGVLLICYLDEESGHTVRGLATALNVSKPAITRALDRLTDLELATRKVDQADRRSILVQQTGKGVSFLRDLRAIMSANVAEQGKQLAALENATPQPVPQRELADA
jgi:DNA-binding MarR family transcriptional regulator